MLALIASSGEKPFKLVFVKGTGKDEGQLSEKLCLYGAPNPKDREAKTSGERKRKQRTSHLESNTIPLTEVGSRHLLTPFISHIISFNGRKVYH